ncbi:MAG: carbon-nitrogen family hydrolase [Nitrospirae bacterium]|nr:carbon-nitrogen family hydrolase [Nitrospirota bacterium]
MKIALAQMNIAWEDKAANLARAVELIESASSRGCDVIAFPEMFNSGFSMNHSAFAEEGLGETSALLSESAKKYGIYVIAGYAIKSPYEEKARNMAFIFDKKGLLTATYTKMRPFSFASEDKHYIAGEHTALFDIDNTPSSVFICYDLRFPELFRQVAREIQIIFVIASWPASRKEHWLTLLKARAIENQCFIIGVNRTGSDNNGIEYSGASIVISPSGDVLCLGNEKDELLFCEINTDETAQVRSRFPFLDDMKLEFQT